MAIPSERIGYVNDSIVGRRVEDAESTANGSSVMTENIPGKGRTWRQVVSIRSNRIAEIVQFVTDAEIEIQMLRHSPPVFQIHAHIRISRRDRRISEGYLETLCEPQVERLKGRDRRRTQCRAHEGARKLSEIESSWEIDMRFDRVTAQQKLGSDFEQMCSSARTELFRDLLPMPEQTTWQQGVAVEVAKPVDVDLRAELFCRRHPKGTVVVLVMKLIYRAGTERLHPSQDCGV